ncbi:MAG: IS630 family transposase [Actinomycetota bacterium]|nr:IS630 family transposase [Actinomycetota bacterium]
MKQIQAGAHPEDVAESLGMDRSTVFAWVAKFREGGLEELRAKPVPGRPPKLSGAQLRKLYTLIVGFNPRQLQFEFALWTREIVRELIRREFGVALSAVSVGRLLRTIDLSPQRPLSRAYQQDPEAVQRWKAQQYPAIRAEAKKLGATMYFADEASVHSDYHAETTWAPVGHTPVVATTGARLAVNMISAVTASGSFKDDIVHGSLDAEKFIDFCDKLLTDTPGPVFLIVDGHPVHRSSAVKKYVAGTDGRLRLFRLPSYSPELNPDEGVWKNVTHDTVGRRATTNPDDFTATIITALERLTRLPQLIRAFFGDPHLRYITT